MSSVKFPVPLPLEATETAASLEQWKNSFTTYAQRDPLFLPFLTNSWDSGAVNRGFRDIERGLSAAEQSTNCELFLKHVSSYLKYPFWNKRILNRTTNLKSVWKIFDEIFGIEQTADSLLDISSMKYNGSEPYNSFLARIQFHLENHLPKAGITVDGISSGPTGEKMTIKPKGSAIADSPQSNQIAPNQSCIITL